MTRKTSRLRFLTLTLTILTLASCNGNLLFTDETVMPDNTWTLFNNPEFTWTVADTIQRTDIFFTIRNGSQYPFRNIFLFVTTLSPDGKSITDTLEYFLADEKGKWLGTGFGDIRELKLPYRQNVYFPSKGTYLFSIQHGMREADLRGIYDVGLRIEKHLN